MEIVIVGSGIGGLASALTLRRQGHHVTVFEQSRLNQETGAAIFLPPNANSLLRECNFTPEKQGANLCLAWRMYKADGRLDLHETFSVDEYPAPWQMIHRQKLHHGLRTLAEDPSEPGPPVKIVTSSRVIGVDANNATVHFENGGHAQGDVVIGADGVNSVARAAVQQRYGSDVTPFSAGHNCFRFLILRDRLLADPVTKSIFEARDALSVWTAEDRKLVCYPCDDNATMNFVAIHPSELSDAGQATGWHSRGNKVDLISTYNTFCPEVRAILSHADPENIRLYPLMDMDPLPGWTRDSLALLGDAAHPFLPHMGQGGAQAIEDAASLGVFLSAESKPSEVAARLGLYELARKDRAHQIQQATRICGLKPSELEKMSFDFKAEREYQFLHDEFENSRNVLHCRSSELKA